MDTPWKRARVQQRSQAQERRMAQSSGGSKQLNSGRVWFSKRDSKKFNFLVENRLVVSAKQYCIKAEELGKMTRDAFFHNSLPAMNIEFEKPHEDWMLIRTIDFADMHEHILQLKAEIINMREENE